MDIIIGAGISGLSYAATTKNNYLILEADNNIGGYCKTIYDGPYVWDYSGHFFHFQREDIKDFVMSALTDDDIVKVNKLTQILYKDVNGKNVHVDFPFQKNIHQLNKQEFIDCLYDLFAVDSHNTFHTFKEMLYCKFGKSIADKFLIPYNEKLYATDLNNLSVDAMGRFFPYANKEEIIKNFKQSADASYNSFFIYPRKGAIKIVESLATHVNPNLISTNERVISIDLTNHLVTTNKRSLTYDNLISTCPFPKLLDMCGIEYNKSIYSWNKVLVFNLGFDAKGPEQRNCWLYFPNKEYVFYRVGFYDNILGQNKTSLYVEIGFGKDEEVSQLNNLLENVIKDLKKVGIITNQKLVAEHHIIMNPAYVHISEESECDKQEKMTLLQKYHTYSIGRYGAWKYCSIEDNIIDGIKLANEIN